MFLLRKKADDEIIRQVLAGRKEAYSILVERYLPVVYGLALARTGNRADADDTTQETFLKAFVSLDQLRDGKKFGPWLISIAKNVCGQMARVSRRETAFISNLALDGMVTPPNLEREELKQVLWDEIQNLDEASRDILVLHYRAGKSSREIAALLEISDEAARKRLQRAREALSDRLLPNLQKEQEAAKSYRERAKRIMGLIAITAAPWQPAVVPTATGSLLATLGSVGTFAAAHKMAGLAAALLVVTMTGTVGYLQRPAVVRHASVTPAAVGLSRESQTTPPASRVAPALDEALGSLLKRVRNGGDALPDSLDEDRELNRAWSLIRPESGPGAIDGVVIYADGRVAEGARVDLIRGDKQLGTPGPYHDTFEDEPPNGIWKTTYADSKGRFTFANLPIMEYSLMARSEGGFLLRTLSGLRFASQTRMDTIIFLELHEAGPIAGKVVTEDGRPIQGAVVYPYFNAREPISERALAPSWQKGLAATTDSSGQFRFDSLQLPRWKFLVTAPGYASTITDLVEVGETSKEIVLQHGGSASGQLVVAGTNRPLSDVVVRISPVNWYFDRHEAVTGQDGFFSVTGLQAGEWIAELDSRFFTLPLGVVRFTVGGDGSATDLRLEARGGSCLTGNVRDSINNLPVAGTQVVAWNTPEGGGPVHPYLSAPTDSGGEFLVPALPPGQYTVELYREGQSLQPNPVPQTVVLAGDKAEGARLTLVMPSPAPDTVLTGLVSDAEGRPVACAAVRGEVDGEPVAAAFTDSRGRFELAGLPDVPNLQVYARKSDYLTSRRVSPGKERNVMLRLEAAASLDGRLLDTSGNPLLAGNKKAVVTAVPVSPTDAPIVHILTGMQGLFRLTGLTGGTYDLYIESEKVEDGFPPKTRIRQVEVVPGQDLNGIDLVYGQQNEEYTLAGHVDRADGAPASDAMVVAEGPVRREVATGADGRFILRGLPQGAYKLIARSHSAGVGSGTGNAGDTDREIKLLGLGEVSGRVIDSKTGQPVKNYEIGAGRDLYYVAGATPDVKAMNRVYDASGQFHVKLVPVGNAVLTVHAPGYAPAVTALNDIRPGECKNDVVVPLERGGEIRGRATGAGVPLQGQLIWIQSGNISLSARTNDQGCYRIINVPLGDCTVNMTVQQGLQGERSISRPYHVSAVGPNSVDLALQFADGALAGVVTVAGKAPSRAYLHVKVSVPRGGSEQLYADVNPNGTYYLDKVPVGTAEVQAFATTDEGAQRISNAIVKTISRAVIRKDFDFPDGMVVSGRVKGVRSDEFAVLVACRGDWPAGTFQTSTVMDDIQPFQVGHATCTPDGAYRVVLDQPGTYTIAALAMPKDREVRQEQAPRAARAVISVTPEAETQVNLTLP